MRFMGWVAVLATLVPCGVVQAFSFEKGEFSGSIKNRITIGATWRMQDRDNNYLAKLNVPGQQALCDSGQDSITFAGVTIPGPDPLGGCLFAGFETLYNAPGSYAAHATDDGTMNYDQHDLVGAASKWTADYNFQWRNFRFVARTIAVADPVNTDFVETHNSHFYTCAEHLDDDPSNDTDRICGGQPQYTQREKAAEVAYFDLNLETAYLEATAEWFGQIQEFRVGKQLVRWGESLALPVNSLNTINVPDTVRLATPGFALDELYDPVNLFYFRSGLTDAMSAEFVYLLEWEPVRVVPPGSFSSPADFIGVGSGRSTIALGSGPAREDPSNLFDRPFGTDIDIGQFGRPCLAFPDGNAEQGSGNERLNQAAHRGQMEYDAERDGLTPVDSEPLLDYSSGRQACVVQTGADGHGQWGAKLNYYAQNLGGREFGFYYLNYHSRLPYVSTRATQLKSRTTSPGLPDPTGAIDTLFKEPLIGNENRASGGFRQGQGGVSAA